MVRRARLSNFAANLREQWRELDLPSANANLIVAVSGGADSTALLLGIEELITGNKLKIRPIVAHLDHALREQSEDDARWVKRLAKSLSFSSTISRVEIKAKSDNLEQAARQARYEFLLATATKNKSEYVL